jgi:hypothetical protein
MESYSSGWVPRDFGIKAFSPEEIGYHDHIMMQEGLIEPADIKSKGLTGVARSLTWKGHEFLDLAREQERWNRAKAVIAKVGGAPISVWMKVLTDLTLQGVDTVATKTS